MPGTTTFEAALAISASSLSCWEINSFAAASLFAVTALEDLITLLFAGSDVSPDAVKSISLGVSSIFFLRDEDETTAFLTTGFFGSGFSSFHYV
ncbi:MAG TPA: hypothetical protein PLT55_04105, partial [Acidimicrobiia bacterium]|nr:hypothetical protein [Acidimicrobiia bacterium]